MKKNSPLIELHLHLEGSVYPFQLIKLCDKYGVLPDLSVYYHKNFNNFLSNFGKIVSLLREKEDFAQILKMHLKNLERQGVVYAEIRISPSVWQYFGVDKFEVVDFLINQSINTSVKHYFIIDCVRQWDKSFICSDFELALKHKDKIRGISIGGDELEKPIKEFTFLFDECKKAKLNFIPHCGEISNWQEVLNAVKMGVRRIGHGIKSVEDKNLLKILKEENVHLEICPTSNYKTFAISNSEIHPLTELYKSGVSFSISTDDPGLFLTTLKKELYIATKMVGKEGQELVFKSALESLKHSLLTDKEKEYFLRRYF